MFRKRMEFLGWDGVPSGADPIVVDLNCVEFHVRVSRYDLARTTLNGVLLRDIGTLPDTVEDLNEVRLDFYPTFNRDGTPVLYIDKLTFANFGTPTFRGSVIMVHHVPFL